MTVNQGAVLVENATALGSTTGHTVINSLVGQIQIAGGITVAEPIDIVGVNNQTFGGIDSTGVLRSISGNNTWSGAISLTTATSTDSQNRSAVITVDAGSTLTLSGGLTANMATTGTNRDMWFALGGAGTGFVTTNGILETNGGANNFFSLEKIGIGTWNIQVANGFNGHTVYVNNGTLSLNGAGSFSAPGTGGATASNTIFMTHGGTLELNNTATNVNNRLGTSRNLNFRGGNLTITGNSGANTTETLSGTMVFDIGRATITLAADAGRQLNFTTGAVTRNGGGTLLLRSSQLGNAAGNGVGDHPGEHGDFRLHRSDRRHRDGEQGNSPVGHW